MPKRWRIATHDPERVATLERAAGIPAVVAQLLICRGICDPDAARVFLDAKLSNLRDPEQLPDIPHAVEVLHQAIQDKRRIAVYGDYDADGMTATAILFRCLRLLGAAVSYYVPNRMDEGYGLNHEALQQLAGGGTEVVVTVDCGIASVAEAETAAEAGLTLVITDHHQMADRLPRAAAIVHPGLPGSDYPFAGLCGAAVAFKLAWALCQRASKARRVSDPMREFLLQAVGLAAIGTVADVVPLIDENRIIVRHGLNSLRHHPVPGIKALERVTGLDKKRELGGEDVAFTLGPRLNAAGRLGQAQLGIELLTTDSEERALELAKYIQELNENRQTLERSVYRAAHQQAKEDFDPHNDPALVLSGRGWHAGVIGIVAGKLAEKYHRPVVILSLDNLGTKSAAGSARSIPGFALHEALAACQQFLVTHGGHAAAAGLTLEERSIDAFRTAFCEYAKTNISTDESLAEIFIDAETSLAMLTQRTVRQIESLAPFGHGNKRPVLCANDITLAEPPKRIGTGERHLSLKLLQHGMSMRAVAFDGGSWHDELAGMQGPMAVAFQPIINSFRGRQSVEMHLADWRPQHEDAPNRLAASVS